MTIQKTKSIPLNELIVGEAYQIHARNIKIGIWDGEAFHGIREKFGYKYIDKEIHYDLSEHYGTAIAIKHLTGV